MSALTDTLIDGLNTLLKSGSEIPATRLRAYEALVVGAIGTLEARARGNTFIYANGKPDDALGMEGDLGVNRVNGDFYQYTGGAFVFLYNVLPGKVVAGNFDPFDVPEELKNWVVDPARTWFGPPGGEAVYLQDALPASAIPGHSWDDADTNVAYLIKPIGFANATRITCQRTALFAPAP